MMSVSFPVVAQKALRLRRYVHTKHLVFFIHKSTTPPFSLNLFLFLLLDTNFEVSGPFCATRNLWTEKNKPSRRTEGEEGEEE